MDVHEETVLFGGVESGDPEAAVWEHAAALFGEDHLGSAPVELVPHAVVVEADADASEDALGGQVFRRFGGFFSRDPVHVTALLHPPLTEAGGGVVARRGAGDTILKQHHVSVFLSRSH